MSVMIDEDPASAPRPGLAGGFEGGPPAGVSAEIWRRLLFTLGVLFVYRIGSALPIPGLDLLAVRALFAARAAGILGLLDGIAGRGIQEVSIFALGIMPYVSAFIVVQLASFVVPKLGGLATDGAARQTRLNQYARILAAILAAFQAIGVASALAAVPEFVTMPGLLFEATTVVTLVAGALLLTWLAEQISARGLGSGALVILAFGVAGSLPHLLALALDMYHSGELELLWLIASLTMIAIVVAVVACVERAERRIPCSDPGRLDGHEIPAQPINPAGVIPALAAGIFIAPLWASITSFGGGETTSAGYFTGSVGYLPLYGALIIIFAAFFHSAMLNREGRLVPSGEPLSGNGSVKGTAGLFQAPHIALATVYATAVCVLPLLFFEWKHLPFVLSGFHIFLLAWLMVRILDHVRPLPRP